MLVCLRVGQQQRDGGSTGGGGGVAVGAVGCWDE